MGVFKNIAKIEELIEANVPGSWFIYHETCRCPKGQDLP